MPLIAMQSLQGLSACLFHIQQREFARNGANVLADRHKFDEIRDKYAVAADFLISPEYFQITLTCLLAAINCPA